MTFTGTLLPYQPEAVDRMVERGNLLLSYDLGLGKTVITIAAIEQLMDTERIRKPGLVVCLSSLKYQWAESIQQFTQDTSIALVIDGTPAKRKEQYERAMAWESDYTILSYEQVVRDWEQVRRLPRGFVVLDEATAIKHFRSQRSLRVKELNSPFRYALTGTPIENGKPEELYSIMQYVDPKLLGRFDLFDRTFIVRNDWGGVQRYRNLKTLHKTLMTGCARKGQDDPDVSPYLPAVQTMPPLRIAFDAAGARLYNHIKRDLLAELNDAQLAFGNFSLEAHYGMEHGSAEDNALRGAIMSKLTCLRMLCDHPSLVRISAERYAAGAMQGTAAGSAYASELAERGLLNGLKQAPKFKAALRYIREFLEADEANKVVLFSYFKPTLELLRRELDPISEQPGLSSEEDPWALCAMYTGDLSAKEKETQKKLFQTQPQRRVLLSSDAGGYGVDLPQANLLINYDLPWASGTAKQRNGRIRRASSKFSHIVIQDVVMRGSIEERQWESLQVKDAVASAIIDGTGMDSCGRLTLTLDSLATFLATSTVG